MDPDVIGRIAESKIQEAIDEGKFDNLPGKGKPIVFDDDPLTPPHLRLMNRILKNANVLPEWVQLQKDILTERNEATSQRSRLIREHQKQFDRISALPAGHSHAQKFTVWHANSRESYLRRLKSVNNSILKLSLVAPRTVQPPTPIRIDLEMADFDKEFPPLPYGSATPAETATAEKSDRTLKAIARDRYQAGDGGGPVLGWAKTARMLGREGNPPPQVGQIESEDIRRSDVPEDGKKR